MELAGGVQQLIHSDLSPNLATLGTWSASDRGRFALRGNSLVSGSCANS